MTPPPRIVDFKSLLWWFLVFLQFIGGSILIDHYQTGGTCIADYFELVLECNVIFGALFLLNFIVRHYLVIEDTHYYLLSKVNLQIQVQYLIDFLCLAVAVIYIGLGGNLILSSI